MVQASFKPTKNITERDQSERDQSGYLFIMMNYNIICYHVFIDGGSTGKNAVFSLV